MKTLLTILFFLITNKCIAQDSIYVRNTVNKLTSTKFWGRGYTKSGLQKTADFLASEYKKIGLKTNTPNYKQFFSFPVNTFPKKMLVAVNGIALQPGKDFIVSNESSGLVKRANLKKIDSITFLSDPNLKVVLKDKLTWSVSTQIANTTTIIINKKSITQEPNEISVDIENKFNPNFKASNIYGFVKGTKYPDSILMLTAHYDHLGGMGKDTYFPGANDNAAGVATLLSLAKYNVKNPQGKKQVY